MRQRFQAGVGGVLRFTPPECDLFGRPSTPTVTVRSTTGADLTPPISGAQATLDPVDTTIAEAADAGERQIDVASTDGIRPGARYLVSPQSGPRFTVEVAAAGDGTVLLDGPLPAPLEAGDLVQGIELSVPLTAEQCPFPPSTTSTALAVGLTGALSTSLPSTPSGYLRSYRAEFGYVLGGVSYAGEVLYEVRRRLLKPVLTHDEVQDDLPAEWRELEPGGPASLRRLITRAWDDLEDELRAKGFDPSRIMQPEALRRPHRILTVAKVAGRWGPAWREWTQGKHTEFDAALSDALSAADWYDAREDGVQGADEVRFQSVRLTR